MLELFKTSLIAHTNYIVPRILDDKKKIDFYKEMWYYIENIDTFEPVEYTFEIQNEGIKLADKIQRMIYNSLKERFT